MRKRGFGIEEHKQVGMDLYGIREYTVRLMVKIGNAYPNKTGLIGHAEKALASLDRLRSALDSQVFKEHRDLGIEVARIYYPKHDVKGRVGDHRTHVEDQGRECHLERRKGAIINLGGYCPPLNLGRDLGANAFV